MSIDIDLHNLEDDAVLTGEVEEWRAVVGYEGLYEVSPAGLVRSFYKSNRNTHPENHINRHTDQKGYYKARLVSGGVERKHFVHRLVASAFIGPRPNGMQVNHIDGNKKNNSVGNLEYVSASRNTKHAIDLGLRKYRAGESHQSSKLTQSQVDSILKLMGTVTGVDIAKMFGVDSSTIYKIFRGKTWRRAALKAADELNKEQPHETR